MDDKSLSIAAATTEIGILLALLAAIFANVRNRASSVVVLGAITPLVILYLVISFEYLVLHRKDAGWSFHAMWMMTFIPYVACAVLGAALCLVPAPRHLAARFGLGLLAPGTVAGLIALGF